MSKNIFIPTWIELSRSALIHNIDLIYSRRSKKVSVCFCVKGNGYGHGIIEIASIVHAYKPDTWLAVHSLQDAYTLRSHFPKANVYIMGILLLNEIHHAISIDARFIILDKEQLHIANYEAARQKKTAHVHIKIETGNNRQGINMKEALALCKEIHKRKNVHIEGIATHFANIEDIPLARRKHIYPLQISSLHAKNNYPRIQLERFTQSISLLKSEGFSFEKIHCANSAATLLFPETHFTMVRPGIALYGMWPSEEVKKIYEKIHGEKLCPVLSWKTRIVQIKNVPEGSLIGYGSTYRTKRRSKIAVLPVGYYDGYDRGLGNKGYVNIHGKKAPVRGRICMNLMMVDCTNISQAREEDEVVLLGENEVNVDTIASAAQTINYELTTRLRESIPRIIVD